MLALPGHLSSSPVFVCFVLLRILEVFFSNLFVFLFVFFWSLSCLSCFDLWCLITPFASPDYPMVHQKIVHETTIKCIQTMVWCIETVTILQSSNIYHPWNKYYETIVTCVRCTLFPLPMVIGTVSSVGRVLAYERDVMGWNPIGDTMLCCCTCIPALKQQLL